MPFEGAPFFFASRRRHTRCLSDWSSDVCSSDLIVRALPNAERVTLDVDLTSHYLKGDEPSNPPINAGDLVRSEERRVGKECRPRGLPARKQHAWSEPENGCNPHTEHHSVRTVQW